jgi:hypothetical protein
MDYKELDLLTDYKEERDLEEIGNRDLIYGFKKSIGLLEEIIEEIEGKEDINLTSKFYINYIIYHNINSLYEISKMLELGTDQTINEIDELLMK